MGEFFHAFAASLVPYAPVLAVFVMAAVFSVGLAVIEWWERK